MAGLGRGEPGLALAVARQIIIEHLLRDGGIGRKLHAARITLGGGIGDRRRLIDRSLRGALLGLGLGDQGLCGLDPDFGTGQLRLGLALLRVQLHHIHLHQQITRLDQIALGCGNLCNPPAGQGRDINLGRLDPAIGRGEPRRQTRRLQPVPGQPAKRRRCGQPRQDDSVPLCHDPPLTLC